MTADHGDASDDLGTSSERAETYDMLKAEAEAQPATTFTDDAVYDATTRLVEALTAQLLNAAHIRTPRPPRRLRLR